MGNIFKRVKSSIKIFFIYIFTTGVKDTNKCVKCGRCMSGKKGCPTLK